jgi:hypothetical protein
MSVTQYAAHLLLAGLTTGIVVVTYFGGIGVVTATHLVGLGCSGAILGRWRTEHGLWMLAILLLLVFGGVYFVSAAGQLADCLRGAPQLDLALAVDVAIGSLLFSTNIRFLYRVAKENLAVR